jgi:hypothetical protein
MHSLDITTSCNYSMNWFRKGRPAQPNHLRRSEDLQVRLTASDLVGLKEASRRLGEPMGNLLGEGALLIQSRGEKGGSSKRRER